MNRIFYFIISILLFSCKDSKKQQESIQEDCDLKRLINYKFPQRNFIEKKILVYSLSSNRDTIPKIFKKYFTLEINKDSIVIIVKKNVQNETVDSTRFLLNDGVPKILESYTKVKENSNLLPAKEIISGNPYCEFTTYRRHFEYDIPTTQGLVNRKFIGHITHKKYVTRKFKGVNYKCVIFESETQLIASLNETENKINGTTRNCYCENIGLISSTVSIENGLIIENKLVEIIQQ